MRWIKREEEEPEWERWFALYSVPVGKDGNGGKFPSNAGDMMVWLEVVERKWLSFEYSNSYEYRLPQEVKK